MSDIQRISTYKDYLGELTATYKRTSKAITTINNSNDINEFIKPYFDHCMDDHEELKVMHLNNRNQVVNVHNHSVGGLTGTVLDKRLVLREALLIQCVGISIIHNHPSGKLVPSEADKSTTFDLKRGCETVGLVLLDSIIVSSEGYFSFADNGFL